MEGANWRNIKTNEAPFGRKSYEFFYDKESGEIAEKQLKVVSRIVAPAATVESQRIDEIIQRNDFVTGIRSLISGEIQPRLRRQ